MRAGVRGGAEPAPVGPVEVVATLLEHRRTKPDSSWAVANVELAEIVAGAEHVGRRAPGAKFSAVGARMGLAAAGETLRLRGAFESTQYGEQFRVDEQSSVGITSGAQASRWLERLDGVGPKRAGRLHDHFGDRIVAVLEAELEPGVPDPLTEVDGISPAVARTIRESWGELGASGSVEDLRYLDGLGCTRYQVNSIMDFCRKRRTSPKELLTTEPYALTGARGFGFKRTDEVALAAGTSRLAPARVDAAVLFQAGECCDGDTMVRFGQLASQAAELVGVETQLVVEAIARLTAQGRLTQTRDEKPDGRTVRWVHPPDLVAAERSIFQLARRASERAAQDAQPLETPSPAATNVVANVATSVLKHADRMPLEVLEGVVEPWE